MPRLNYGTLLENILVLECTRLCLDHLAGADSFAFASSFAMPPLTQCWCKPNESSPCFTHNHLMQVSRTLSPRGSLQQMWSLCLANSPNLPLQAFQTPPGLCLYEFGGPNGALLASMLAVQRRHPVHLWVNDDADRYRPVQKTQGGQEGARDTFDTLAQAGKLLGMKAFGSVCEVVDRFPNSISNLSNWLASGVGREGSVCLGFLDPDNYAEGHTQVSPLEHQHWLRALATGRAKVFSVMFSGCQNRGSENAERNQRLTMFHGDELGLYPHSLVFEYGNFQTGVKIRWPGDSVHGVIDELRQRVDGAWRDWSTSLGVLTVHSDGRAAS